MIFLPMSLLSFFVRSFLNCQFLSIFKFKTSSEIVYKRNTYKSLTRMRNFRNGMPRLQVILTSMLHKNTDTADYAGEGAGFRPLDYWNWGFKSHWGHGCSSLAFVSAVYVGVFLILCDLETPKVTWPGSELGCCVAEEEEEKRKLQKKKGTHWISLFQDMEKDQVVVILAINILFPRLTVIFLCSFCTEEDISPTY